MASVVPYTGTPSVAPEQPATPTRQVNAPIEAFGGAVAQATQHLGQVEASTGDELFARANAIQQLNEQASASKAAADLTTGLATEYAKYTTLEGKDAVDYLPTYLKNVNDMRDKIRGTLNSPYAQRAYDQESRNTISRTMFSAAKHAGDQNKVYIVGSATDKATADANFAGQHPEDTGAYEQAIQTNNSTGKLVATVKGRDGDYATNTTLDLNNNLVVNRVTGAMQKDTVAAQKILDDAKARGIVSGGSADSLQKQIDSTRLNKTSVAEAANIYNDPANTNATAEDLKGKAAARAESMAPGDAVFKDKLIQQTETLRARDQTFKRADEYDRKQTMEGAVYGVGNQDGKLPTSINDFTPEAHAAYINATPNDQAAVDRRLSANAKGDYRPTPENQDTVRYWKGVMTDPTATAAEREKAINTNFYDLKVPAQDAQTLMNLRNKLYKNSMNDVTLPKAMGLISGMLTPELGLNKARNPDDYYRFTGAFGEVLKQHQDELKRPLNNDEIRQDAANLLQKVHTPGWFGSSFGSGSTPLFRDVTSSTFQGYKDLVVKQSKANGSEPPDDSTIQNMWTASRVKALSNGFTTLFGKSTQRAPQ